MSLLVILLVFVAAAPFVTGFAMQAAGARLGRDVVVFGARMLPFYAFLAVAAVLGVAS